MFSGNEIKEETDKYEVKNELLDPPVEFSCNACNLRFEDEIVFVQHMSYMHNYEDDENGAGTEDEEIEEEQEEIDYNDGLLSLPPEPQAPTTVVLKPNSIEALIGSGFKAVLDKLNMIEDRLVKIESKVNKLEKDRMDLQDYLQFQDPVPPPPKKGRPETFPTLLKAVTDIDFTINDSQLETAENKQFLEEYFMRNIPKTIDYKLFLRSGLGLLMTPEAQQSFSWSGRCENIKIKDFNSMKILNTLCQKELGTPYDIIEGYWRKYFANVKNPGRAKPKPDVCEVEHQENMVGHLIDY